MILPVGLLGLYFHRKNGLTDGKAAWPLLLGGLPGVLLGVLLGTCLMDEYAPPKGQAAIYNRLTCPKQWKLYPKYVHERVNFFENQMLRFFKDGIPEA